MTGLQRLCLLTLAVVLGLIVLGGAVRATDSGLGCPDWPRCHGSFIPKWEKHTLIEYTHRLVASVAGLMVFAIAAVAWRSYRRAAAITYPASMAAVLIVIQGGLGGLTVLAELPPEIVAVHLGTALVLVFLLMLVTAAAFADNRPLSRLRLPPGFGRLAAMAAGGLFALMVVGSYVAGAGYSLSCSGWPLCNGQVVPDTRAASVQLHFFHRVLALLTGAMMAVLAWWGWRWRARAPLAAALTIAALGVFVVQSLIGAANIWTRADDAVQIGHLAAGTVLWVVVMMLVIRVHGLQALFSERRSAASAGRTPETRPAGALR